MVKLLWFAFLVLACAASSAAAAGPSALFAEDAPLHLTLTAPFAALVRAAPTSTAPVAATLTVSDGAGPAQVLQIQLRPRGHFRRTSGSCWFPPLLLRFDKATARGTPFHGQHKLKLVTYCRPQPEYEQHIVLEYLIYRLYNLLTPMSFRARPAQVTYQEAGSRGAGLSRFGFLIEDIGDVADRNGVATLNVASHQIGLAQLDQHAAARAALFEYMIGNLDWEFLAAPPGAECCHNIRLVAASGAAPAAASAVTPVPYDFDYSGFVDPPYAGPPENIPIDRLTERYYRGYCASNGEVGPVIDEFRARRAQMIAVIAGEPLLSQAFLAKTTRFLDEFFAVLDDPARVRREITGHCR